MDSLKKFIKTEKIRTKVTSINLESKHIEFVQMKRLNLSSLIRDFLDGLIKEDEKQKSK